MKKVHMLNLGCSKNLVDSESLIGELQNAGLQKTVDPEDSDLLIVNTCGFIEAAKEESVDEILSVLKQKKASQKVLVSGCLSERYMDELKKEMPEVNYWLGTWKKGQILQELGLKELSSGCLKIPRTYDQGQRHQAYLKIAEGCNRNCSFCAIPGIRGKQISQPIPDLIHETQILQQQGIQELTLIAQDLTFYGREKNGPQTSLSELLKSLIAETDIPWIRMMYAYPAFVDDQLLDLMANEKRICSYLDIPVQHASDRILKLMRRGHTRQSLLDMLRKIRKDVPEIALRSTVLLGFPGETDQDFKELLDFVEEFRFERLGGFTWSEEEGTHAVTLDEKRVPEEVAEQRLETLMGIQQNISLQRNESLIGQELEVLIDEVAEESDYHFRARTQWDAPEVDNQVLISEGDATVGTFRKVKIVDGSEYDLDAVLLP